MVTAHEHGGERVTPQLIYKQFNDTNSWYALLCRCSNLKVRWTILQIGFNLLCYLVKYWLQIVCRHLISTRVSTVIEDINWKLTERCSSKQCCDVVINSTVLSTRRIYPCLFTSKLSSVLICTKYVRLYLTSQLGFVVFDSKRSGRRYPLHRNKYHKDTLYKRCSYAFQTVKRWSCALLNQHTLAFKKNCKQNSWLVYMFMSQMDIQIGNSKIHCFFDDVEWLLKNIGIISQLSFKLSLCWILFE